MPGMSVDKRVGVLRYRRHLKHRGRDENDDFDPCELMDNEEAEEASSATLNLRSGEGENEVPPRMDITYGKKGRAKRVIVYDDDGSINRTVHYVYDGEGRMKLVTLEYPDRTDELHYVYDAVGRLVETRWQANGELIERSETGYLADGDGIVRKFDASNVLCQIFLMKRQPDGLETCHAVPVEQWDSVTTQTPFAL